MLKGWDISRFFAVVIITLVLSSQLSLMPPVSGTGGEQHDSKPESGGGEEILASTLGRNMEPVIITGSQIPNLIGTAVNNTDVFSADNDLLVYVWNATSLEWSQIPFQVDERNNTNGSYIYGSSSGFLDLNDELVLYSGDMGDRAPVNEWVVGCDGPRYEIKVSEPFSANTGWAYVYTSENDRAEASFAQDHVNFDMVENNISTANYNLGFNSTASWILNYLNVTPLGGGSGASIMDRLNLEFYASVVPVIGDAIAMEITENNITADFMFKKDGCARAMASSEFSTSVNESGIIVNISMTMSWKFYPNDVRLLGDIDMEIIDGGLAEVYLHNMNMSFDHASGVTPMSYRDSLGNIGQINGVMEAAEMAFIPTMNTWWEVNSAAHGGYVAVWDMSGIVAQQVHMNYDDDSTIPGHLGSEPGYYGRAGMKALNLADIQSTSFFLNVYPLAAGKTNVGFLYEYQIQNPLLITPALQRSPTVWVEKTVDVETAGYGDFVNYTIYFNNTGDRNAQNVWIDDILPAGVTYVGDTAALEGGVRTGDFNWTFAIVPPGQHSFAVSVTVDKGVYSDTTLFNTAECGFTNHLGQQMPRKNATASFEVVVHGPFIEITKISDRAIAMPGEQVQFTIFFNNTGSSVASTVWINDTLPADLDYLSDTSASEGGVKTGDYNWTFTNIGQGEHSFLINVTADPSIIGDRWANNTASVEYVNETGVKFASSISTAPVWILTIAVFDGFAKTANVTDIRVGQQFHYTVFFNNTGNDTSPIIWIDDKLPPGVRYDSDDSALEGGTKTGDFNWTFTNAAPGTHSFQINATLDSIAPNGTVLQNTAELAYDDSESNIIQTGPVDSNVTVLAPDITIEKIVNATYTKSDWLLQYTIYFNNSGQFPAPAVWVNDSLPAGVAYISDSNATEGGVKTGDYNWTFANVTPGLHSFHIDASVIGGQQNGTLLRNLAYLDYAVEDGYISQGNSDYSDTYVMAPNITVVKIANVSRAYADTQVHYTIYFNNTGMDNATVYMNDMFPSEIQYDSDSNATEGGIKTGAFNWTFTNVTPGTHYFVINGTINASTPIGSVIINSVWVPYNDSSNYIIINTGSYYEILVIGPPDRLNVSANPQQLPADGSSTSLVTAWVNDSIGNGVPGLNVTIEIQAGSGSMQGAVQDLGDGRYTRIYLAGTTLGTVQIDANCDEAATQKMWSTLIELTNTPPTASISADQEVLTLETVHFSASGSTDLEGTIVSYQWDFGDGDVDAGETVTHEYLDDGVYTVTLTVTDNHGATDTETFVITVLNRAPVPDIAPVAVSQTLEDILFDASGSYDMDGTIATYSWDFGDGETGSGETATHQYADDGSYPVTLTLTDDDSASASASINVEVLNRPPVAVAGNVSGVVGESITFNASSSYDMDGTIVSYLWDFGDGETGQGQFVNHTYTLPGSYDATLILTDNGGATDTDTITVTISGEAAISVSLISDVTSAGLNDNIILTLFYNNTGSANASDVNITLAMPPGCGFVSSDIVPTGDNEWNMGGVAPGSHSFDVVVQVTGSPSDGSLAFSMTCDYLDIAGVPQQSVDDLTIDFESSAPDSGNFLFDYWWVILAAIIAVAVSAGIMIIRKPKP